MISVAIVLLNNYVYVEACMSVCACLCWEIELHKTDIRGQQFVNTFI